MAENSFTEPNFAPPFYKLILKSLSLLVAYLVEIGEVVFGSDKEGLIDAGVVDVVCGAGQNGHHNLQRR